MKHCPAESPSRQQKPFRQSAQGDYGYLVGQCGQWDERSVPGLKAQSARCNLQQMKPTYHMGVDLICHDENLVLGRDVEDRS
jgi:hypothetical protein